jgi:hypothetical protein
VYRDASVTELTVALDGVFPGAAGLRTNPLTLRFLTDLNEAIARAEGRPFAIVPEMAGYWVASEQPNPLPIDWAATPELIRNENLLDQILNDLDRQRGDIVVIVQKASAASLPSTPSPFPPTPPDESVVSHVRATFQIVAETDYFEVFE